MEKDQNYKAFVYCKNCPFKGEIEIEKGLPISEKECPNCGCIGLERDHNAEYEQKNIRRDSFI